MMNFLFVHGGPGLNSHPERMILNEAFDSNGHKINFWNEPSNKRGTHEGKVTFTDCRNSLIESVRSLAPVTVIAHSYGAFLLNDILPEVEECLERIILLTPVSDLSLLDKNILTVSMNCYPSDEKAAELREYLGHADLNKSFNDERFNKLLLAIQNELYGAHYWFSRESALDYYQYFESEEYGFNLGSYKSIRETSQVERIHNETSVPTTVIFGRHDPFVTLNEEKNIKKYFKNTNVKTFENSAHYCHIEEKEDFVRICLNNSLSRHIEPLSVEEAR